MSALLAGLFPARPDDLADLAPGRTVTVRGEVVARDLIESTLTGTRCVYYRYTVEEWRASHATQLGVDGFWHIVQRDEAITEFYLADARSRVIVSPAQARVECARGVDQTAIDLGGIHDRRAHELSIVPGSLVEVTARVHQADDLFDDGRDYRSSPLRMLLSAPEHSPLLIRLLRR